MERALWETLILSFLILIARKLLGQPKSGQKFEKVWESRRPSRGSEDFGVK